MIWQLVDSSSIGGIERHVATLTAALKAAGHCTEIILLSDHGDNPWFRQLAAQKLSFRVIGGGRALTRALKHDRPRLLHTHGYKSNIIGRLAARALKIPVVSTFHAGERGAFPVSLYQQLDEYTSFLGGRLCVSEVIRDALPFQATLCDNFVMTTAAPRSDQLPRHIAFVGRLSHEKGPDLFCELASRHSDVGEWHLYGDGPMRAELEARFGSVVRFHGLVTDLSDVWPDVGLLVMPSRAEGMPMAALESLSEGVPILASAVGALPRIVIADKTGWLFESGSLVGAANGLAQWSSMSPAEQLVVRRTCRDLIRDGYSDTRHLSTILGVYQASGFRPQAGTALAARRSNHPAVQVQHSP